MGKTDLHVLLRTELTLHSCIYSSRQSSRAAEWQARFGKGAGCGLTGEVDLVGPGARVVRTVNLNLNLGLHSRKYAIYVTAKRGFGWRKRRIKV
jgi:hypothetical protein